MKKTIAIACAFAMMIGGLKHAEQLQAATYQPAYNPSASAVGTEYGYNYLKLGVGAVVIITAVAVAIATSGGHHHHGH